MVAQHNERLARVAQNNKEHAAKLAAEINEKQETAEQLRQKAIGEKVQVAKKWSDKLQKAMESREALESAEQARHGEKIERVNQVTANKEKTLEQTVEKAREHAKKVADTVAAKLERDAAEKEAKAHSVAEKLRVAEELREAQKLVKIAKA